MASGVKIVDDIKILFEGMKVRRVNPTDAEKKSRLKAVLFRMSDDLKNIIVDDQKQLLLCDVGDSDPYETFVKMLPIEDCRYGLYDCSYETKETKKEDLVFVFWAPDKATMKSKMLYASSKDALKKHLVGVKHEWQVNSPEDLKDVKSLMEKFSCSVIAMEGKPVA